MEWSRAFLKAFEAGNYRQCEELLKIRDFSVSTEPFQRGNAHLMVGDYLQDVAQYDRAQQEYLNAIAAYDQELLQEPEDIALLESKSSALLQLAQVQKQLLQQEEALNSCHAAVSICNQMITKALNTQANAVQFAAGLKSDSGYVAEAIQSYLAAVEIYDNCLSLNSTDSRALNNKANALARIAVLEEQTDLNVAIQHCQEALNCYDQALQLNPENCSALNNQATVMRRLGQLNEELGRKESAIQYYQQAISTYDRVLNLSSDFLLALYNKSLTLIVLGDLMQFNQEATLVWQQATLSLNHALQIAPTDEKLLELKACLEERLIEFVSPLYN